mgnify:CR=1 FL=1
MWKVFIINANGSKKMIYNDRWAPTIDSMDIAYAVRGKRYKVLNPQGKDVTSSFPYGEET